MARRVLFCSNVYPPFFIGGAELIAHYQARLLKKAGYEVTVFCGIQAPDRPRYHMEREVYDGLEVYRVALHDADFHTGSNFSHPEIDRLFESVCDVVRPEVAHFHNINGLSLGIIGCAKSRGMRTVLTVHDHWGFCTRNTLLLDDETVCRDTVTCGTCLGTARDEHGRPLSLRMRRDFILYRFSELDAVVSPSRYLADAYERIGIPPAKMHVISNGVDVGRFSQVRREKGDERTRFTFIGYFGRHKGVHILLDALRILAERRILGQRCTVNLVGGGHLESEIRHFIVDHGLGNSVKLWGKVPNAEIEDVYSQTDVLVTPSIWPENEPVSILEAKSAGIPVLASRLGGSIHLVTDGVSGWFFDPGNATDLARRMTEIATQPDQIQEFGRAAQKSVRRNTLDGYAARISDIYAGAPDTAADIERLVICGGGEAVSQAAASIASRTAVGSTDFLYRFVCPDWISERDWEKVDAVWVSGTDDTLPLLYEAMRRGKPLLVPEGNPSLAGLCRRANGGLFYRSDDEAEHCLSFIWNNPETAISLGRNLRNMLIEVQ
ncbi:glycosyltransferase family 4 protein [Skermanella pratensis]|uniref:glycosyltransferase family 4 protein n=1 Tax=Skermanella pratensis TaxID=2233999 RepID=UPI00130170F1|nr:glycosyltransferase family 4 protein [Skermanella pratensis]